MAVPESFIRTIQDRLRMVKLSVDDRVISAFRHVPREYFVWHEKNLAYKDIPLPIPKGQTISAPHMYAMMFAREICSLKPGMDVLEIGAGSGYGAALLAYIVYPGKVISVERHPELVEFAKQNISKIDAPNLEIIEGDGTQLELDQKFDRIFITAAGPKIPESLVQKLKPGGKLIMPLADRGDQWLSIIWVENGDIKIKRCFQVRFVPLVGEDGYSG